MLIRTIVLACLFVSSAIAQAKVKQNATKEWTMLVYLNGFNNLDSFGAKDINEMETIGSTEKVNVVVQWASLKTKKVDRLFVKKDSKPNQVTSPVVQAMGSVDMGDYRSLTDFIKWGHENYPAEHYMVVVWDHGSGWHLTDPAKMSLMKEKGYKPTDISWDDISGNFMTTKQLGISLRDASQIIGRKIDIYASDACLMGMAEIADEMTDSVLYFAGSQELEPGDGWDYSGLLSGWNKLSNATSANVGSVIVDSYFKYYNGSASKGSQVTYSFYDLSVLDDLKRSTAFLANHLIDLSKNSTKALKTTIESAVSFYYSDYVDYVDFLNKLSAQKIQGLDTKVIQDTQKVLSKFVLANKVSSSYKGAGGVSLWMPTNTSTFKAHDEKYLELNFASNSNWNEFLSAINK